MVISPHYFFWHLKIQQALVAVKNLLLLTSTDAMILKDFCDLENKLAKLHQQLHQLITEDTPDGYASDIENLRRDVERVFQEKLQQVRAFLHSFWFFLVISTVYTSGRNLPIHVICVFCRCSGQTSSNMIGREEQEK